MIPNNLNFILVTCKATCDAQDFSQGKLLNSNENN